MMMSKPKPKEEDAAAEATAPTTHRPPRDAVADLERRLADLSSTTTPEVEAVPHPVPPPAAAVASGGKNALLARIMAAQERAKQTAPAAPAAPATPAMMAPPTATMAALPPPTTAPPPAIDLMGFGSAPVAAPPPPAFEDTKMPPPPAFHASTMAPPPPAMPAAAATASRMNLWDPHAPAMAPPPPPPQAMMPPASMMEESSPSAPSFDLLAPEPPPAAMPPPVPPPLIAPEHQQHQQQQHAETNNGLDDEALQAILGIEGLTEDEKQAMIDEQLKLMKSFEDTKKSAQVSAADAFEQRSFSAAVSAVDNRGSSSSATTVKNGMQVHGQEKTREAIADGTAVMVQCTACENWMQVTGTAQLMFCPVCQTVSPVQGSGLTTAEAEQMAADAKLAEQLQREEYKDAERETVASMVGRQTSSDAANGKEQGWLEWMGFGTPAPAPTTNATSSPARRSGDDLRFAGSRDSMDGNEADGLLLGRQGGRIATTQQPLFACVTDSIHTAANYAMNSTTGQDGDVHGVDSSSLLALPQVGRNNNEPSYDRRSGTD